MANLLTISRLFLIPLFLYFLFASPPQRVPATIIFAIAALTDALDGYVARGIGQVTELGKIIDPLTDRFFLMAVVVALFIQFKQPPLFALIIFIIRDLFLLGGYVFLRRKEKQIQVSILGKTATATLMVAFALMILGLPIGEILFFLGLALYILSAIEYVRSAIKIAF